MMRSSTASWPRIRTRRLLAGDITDEPYGLAIAKDHPDFVRFVNAVLEQMHSDGRWTKIWNRWFGSVQWWPADQGTRAAAAELQGLT